MSVKIFTAGHEVPRDDTILNFKCAVQRFLRDNADNGGLLLSNEQIFEVVGMGDNGFLHSTESLEWKPACCGSTDEC